MTLRNWFAKTATRTDVLLLDASVWIGAKVRADRYFEASRALAVDPDHLVAGLDLTLYEIANGLGVRQGHRPEAMDLCRLVSGRCGRNLLAVDAQLLDSALGIAAEHGLTAYDAAYVAAARRHGWTLVSADIADLVSKGLAVTPDAALYP
ncbi:MAG: PIN domain-containing protein [Thermoleophilia bacterium]|nr:PIN domain-containing protein [Thermoleophilia bacterium]